jgi:hypothetical protein
MRVRGIDLGNPTTNVGFTPMPTKSNKRPATAMAMGTTEKLVRVRLRALEIPPVKDGIVIGRDAAIGGEAMSRTLQLMSHEKFERIIFKDEIVQELIVRAAILRKLGRDRLVHFVLKRVKPVMTENELLMLDFEVELVIEDSV